MARTPATDSTAGPAVADAGPAMAEGAAGPTACPGGPHDDRITLMGLLVETHARLTRVLATELESACGLPLTWFDVLIRIGRTPEGYLTMTQLANEVSLTSGGVTRLVDRIEAAGYIERRNCPTDRRSIFVSLTPAGAELLDRAAAEHLRSLDRHLIDPLAPDERAALEAALRKLRGDGPVCGG